MKKKFILIIMSLLWILHPGFAAAANLAESLEQRLVNFVHATVESLHYSDYKLGGSRFDTLRGIYVLDCSNYVDHVLQAVSPPAYSKLVDSIGSDTPTSRDYYQFFTRLSYHPINYWNPVKNVKQLLPGDILVFRYKNRHGVATGGHVMVVMNKPICDRNNYFVQVADSAPTGHSHDTRPSNTAGIGIGTLLLKVNPKTNHPIAYAWGDSAYWNKNVNIAMGRAVDGHRIKS